MFAGGAIALRSWLSWWTVPLALICGWAFGQFVSYSGFSRQASGEGSGATVVWALLVALVSCTCLGLAGDVIMGGRYSGALFAARRPFRRTPYRGHARARRDRLVDLHYP